MQNFAPLNCLLLLLTWLLVHNHTPLVAQNQTEYGIKVGFNYGSVIGPIDKNASGKLVVGAHAGGYLLIPLHSRWLIQPEINYSRKGADFTQSSKTGTSHFDIPEMGWKDFPAPYTSYNLNGNMELHYIEMPILLHYRAGSRVSFYAGPQVAYLAAGKSKITQDIYVGVNVNYPLTVFEDTTANLSGHLQTWDIGMAAGLHLHNNKRLNGTVRLSSSVKSIYRKELAELQANFLNLFINVGIGFRIGKL